MSFFFIVTLILVGTFVAAMVLKRRKKQASRSGRYRSPMGGGLMLERPGGRRRKLLAGFSPRPNHVFLGLVLLVMVAWLGAGFFLGGSETPVAVISENRADAALPEQHSYLSALISPEAASAKANRSAFAPAAPAAPARTAQNRTDGGGDTILKAANSMLPAATRLDQVGLMPAKNGSRTSAPKAAAAKPPAPAAAKPQPSAAAPAVAQAVAAKPQAPPAAPAIAAPAATAAAKPAVEKSTAAASTTPAEAAKPKLATSKPASSKGLLAGSRHYTVHLGSFGDKSNAENYLAQLVAAGETAFISESTVDGRLWHRVMSGRFLSRDEAENYGRNLKRRGLTADTGRYLVKSID